MFITLSSLVLLLRYNYTSRNLARNKNREQERSLSVVIIRMKLSTSAFSLISLHIIGISSVPVKEECGDLGVMDFDVKDLPEGVKPEDVRKCRDHPNSLSSPNNHTNILAQSSRNSCYFGKQAIGCSNLYCWAKCSSNGQSVDDKGEWCWLAGGGGFGPWQGCQTDLDCLKTQDSTGCGVETWWPCPACGCGC